MTNVPKAAKAASSSGGGGDGGVGASRSGGGNANHVAPAMTAVTSKKKNSIPPPPPAEEDESVTDLYTTDGTLASQPRTTLLAGGVGNDVMLTDEEYRKQVRLEQERIFRDYKLELPIVTPPPPTDHRAGGQPRGFLPQDEADNVNNDDGTQVDEQSLLTFTVMEEEEEDGAGAVAVAPRDPSSKSKNAHDSNADAQSVLTDNPIFRANMEAEERRLMAEFDFDYSVKSSFDDHMDAYYAPPVMMAGVGAYPPGGGGGGPSRCGGATGRSSFFAPLAPSVATDTDLDGNSTLPDYSLVEEGGGGPRHQVVVLAPEGADEEEGGAILGVSVLATRGEGAGRGGPNLATKSASSSLSSLRSLPFLNTLKILLPSAITSSSATTPAGAAATAAAAEEAGLRQNKNPADRESPSRSGSSTGVSDTSSPTSKTQTPTATDSNGQQNTATNSTPSRKDAYEGGGGGAGFGNGKSPERAIDGVQGKPVPPSIIILGTSSGIDDYADDPTLGDHDPDVNGRALPPSGGASRAGRRRDDGGGRHREMVRKTMHRLWRDWLGRVILLLLLAMLLSIGVAVGGLVAYRSRSSASTGTSSSTLQPPPQASNSSHAESADDGFFFTPPSNVTQGENSASEDESEPPETEESVAPSLAPVAETASTDAPTNLRATKAPSPAPASTGEPTSSVVPPLPPPDDCQDDPNATFFVNDRFGDRDCAFLADRPGIQDLLCQDQYDPSRMCPVTCGTCPDPSSAGATASPTPSPIATETPTTIEPTNAPTAEATLEETTAVPSSTSTVSPTIETTSEPSSNTVSASLREMIANVAPESVLSRLDGGSSAPSQAFSWLERDVEAYGGSDEQVVQRYALATLAYSLESDQWGDGSGWLDSNAGECDWYGVSCDDGDRITSIDLEQNGLRGTLPPELSLLSGSLTELNVNENSISGELPTEVGLLQSLETLLMANNNFKGPLPTEIGSMESLTVWHLEKNSMTGSIPSAVENLENLAELSIWGNGFTGDSSELCDLDSLQDLIVDCDSSIDCFTRCYFQCGGDTGIDCQNRALLGTATSYGSA